LRKFSCARARAYGEIEKACEVDVAFRVVAGNGRPDHAAICRFCSEHEEAMKGLIPEEIDRRSNMGLEMPHSSWFLRDLEGLADRYSSREAVGRSGLHAHYR